MPDSRYFSKEGWESSKCYVEPTGEKWLRFFLIPAFYVSQAALVVMVFGGFRLVFGYFHGYASIRHLLSELLPMIGGVCLLLILPISGANVYSAVRVVETGLWIRLFFFRFIWKFIPWDKIEEIVPSPVPIYRAPILVLHIKNLPYFCRILSLVYKAGVQPGILLWPGTRDLAELVRIVQSHLRGLDKV